MNWNFQGVFPYIPDLLKASLMTIELVVFSSALGLVLGVILALLRLSKNPLVFTLPFAFITFFRGTPLLIQIFLIYYGLGQFDVIKNSVLWQPVLSQAYWCAIIALTLNTSAYVAEIVRGAIKAVPKGELEAGDVLGMTPVQKFVRITMPRAFGIMIPAYSNEVIFLLKGSALVSTITVADLMYSVKGIIAKTYLNMEVYVVVAVVYLMFSWVLLGVFHLLEKRINHHKRIAR